MEEQNSEFEKSFVYADKVVFVLLLLNEKWKTFDENSSAESGRYN